MQVVLSCEFARDGHRVRVGELLQFALLRFESKQRDSACAKLLLRSSDLAHVIAILDVKKSSSAGVEGGCSVRFNS